MFLKSLTIENSGNIIRDIKFHKGINLIIDETKSVDRKETGNNVGKTTVLRLIDYCLGGDGKNIYMDTEFKQKTNTDIERFLTNNNVMITLTLIKDINEPHSDEITIRRNFLKYKNKILEINGEQCNENELKRKLKELIFNTTCEKPKFRQIIAKNIRYEKSRLLNTLKVLFMGKSEEYEALYLYWLGIEIDHNARKQTLIREKSIEENLQKRLKKEKNKSQIEQSLIVLDRKITGLERKKDNLSINDEYKKEISELNRTKADINRLSTGLSRLEFRKSLIEESKEDLRKERSDVDIKNIKALYSEAKALIPIIQKTFEDTLIFHNQMIEERIKYITKELPEIEAEIARIKRALDEKLIIEKSLSESLRKKEFIEDINIIIKELNDAYEEKGRYEEMKSLWESTEKKLNGIKKELDSINAGIESKDDLIKERIESFNKYFSEISYRLYGEHFILSYAKNDKGYELEIGSISGNLGTGKKKGQIAAFDLAYIQFAEANDIECLHFILHDQIENVHDHQISNLLTEIVSNVNCQYILPVLKDKLPEDIDTDKYKILSLSQSVKLFKI
ncbi:MAG: DUF2326 domain-containing protein [Spirochaetes bacterium]|nr:DUF2326 domain-containing protein [Spirochaetota bacterium]